jgi:hypothetical protein
LSHSGDAENKSEDPHKAPDDPVKNIVGPAFAALPAAILAGLALLTFHFADTIGWALAGLIWLVEVIFVGWLIANFIRYFEILGAGADSMGSRKRQAYSALRDDLQKGGRPAVLYSRWLPLFLNAVDRFFGDARRTPAPLWTAASLDRCLLLALIYPIVTIFLIWTISGHVGPAELALHVDPRLGMLRRFFPTAVIGLCLFAIWGAVGTTGWRRFCFVVACIAAFVLAIVLSVGAGAPAATPAPIAYAPIPSAVPPVMTGNSVTTILSINVTTAVTIAIALTGSVIAAIAIAAIGAVLAAIRRLNLAGKHRWEGLFLSFVITALILVSLGAAKWLSPLSIWPISGPLLLFLGLLTLLNAPFDWISVGLTRALLRGGLQLGGWWPYLLALLDAVLAALIIAVLALTMVIGVRAFDAFAVQGGGKAVLPLTPLFDGIAAYPTAPEYWWIYALLLSTMIPSLINLVIGGASFLRGIPGLPALLLRSIREGEAMPIGDRFWISLVLTGQLAGGVLLGIAAQGFLVAGIIGYVMPRLGLGLLDMARDISSP